MSQKLLISLVMLATLPAQAAPKASPVPIEESPVNTTSGPRSDAEAKFLANEAKTALAAGKQEIAADTLERLIARYPAYEGFTEAHFTLARIRMELGQPKRAIGPLKYFIQAMSPAPDSFRARALLGRALIDLKQFHEAMLSGTEILSAKEPKSITPETRFEGYLLKAEAQFELRQNLAARKTLDSALLNVDRKSAASPRLEAQAGWLGLALKLRECRRFPSKDFLDEAQTRDQLDRRGSCLLEATLLYRDTLSPGDLRWAIAGTRDLKAAFNAYHEMCKNPPRPTGRRSTQELANYKAELILVLKQDGRMKLARAQELLEAFRTQISEKSLPALEEMISEIDRKKSSL